MRRTTAGDAAVMRAWCVILEHGGRLREAAAGAPSHRVRAVIAERMGSMALRSTVDGCLATLARGRGIDLSLDANGMVSIDFDDDRQMTLEVPEHGAFAYVHAPVAFLPAQDREATLAVALDLNLFRLDRPGCWLALDRETDRLLLCASFAAADLTAEALEKELGGLLACLDRVSGILRERSSTQEESAASVDLERAGTVVIWS